MVCSVEGRPASQVHAALVITPSLYQAAVYMPAVTETCVQRIWRRHTMCYVIVLLHALSVNTD